METHLNYLAATGWREKSLWLKGKMGSNLAILRTFASLSFPDGTNGKESAY